MAQIIPFRRRLSSASSIEEADRSSPAAFVLVVEDPDSGAQQFIGPFATEESAMSYAEIVIPVLNEGVSFWVTELDAPHETDQLSRDDLMQRGWHVVGEDQSILGGLAYNGMAKDVPPAE
jgi:hypothetical protein